MSMKRTMTRCPGKNLCRRSHATHTCSSPDIVTSRTLLSSVCAPAPDFVCALVSAAGSEGAGGSCREGPDGDDGVGEDGSVGDGPVFAPSICAENAHPSVATTESSGPGWTVSGLRTRKPRRHRQRLRTRGEEGRDAPEREPERGLDVADDAVDDGVDGAARG